MKPLGIIALIIMAIGFATVYAARAIVKKFGLADKQECEHQAEMTEEEVESYKLSKAVFNVKITGIVISVPGLILFLIFFK